MSFAFASCFRASTLGTVRALQISPLHSSHVGLQRVETMQMVRAISQRSTSGIRALRGGADSKVSKVQVLTDSERAELLQPLLKSGV